MCTCLDSLFTKDDCEEVFLGCWDITVRSVGSMKPGQHHEIISTKLQQ